jgi:hypothetical protein
LKFSLEKSKQDTGTQIAYSVATTGPTSAFAFIDSVSSVPSAPGAPSRTPTVQRTGTPGITGTPGVMPTTNNPQADAAVVEINRFRATFGLPPLIYDVSKNADADACAAYDAKNGYHSSMRAGLAKGASGQCECSGSSGVRCVQLYEQEESLVQNPKSDKPICGKITCGHFCIILGSYTHMSSGTSGNFSTHNFYNGSPRCSF